MAILIINTGSTANARNGDSLRTAFNKVNTNFAYLGSSSRSGAQGLIGFTGSRGLTGYWGSIGYTGSSGATTSEQLTWSYYSTEADLPAATTKHGMFAHVHGTGYGYMAHAGVWIKLANYNDIVGTGYTGSVGTAGNSLANGTWTVSLSALGGLVFPDASVQTKAYTGIPGPYANDAASATAGVAVGGLYHKTGTSGQVFVRLA